MPPAVVRQLCLAIVLCAVAFPARALCAQTSQTGIVQGTVTLADGRELANATVSLRHADGSYPRETRTDERGAFRINFISPGTYEVTVRLLGFRPVVYRGIVIRAAEVQRIAVEMAPAPTELGAVTVVADPLIINMGTTEFTSSLSARERELLPAARDANALINFTPGARPGQVFGGSTNQANLYQLDGVMVNQPGSGGSFLLPNVDWIQDFRVIGLGAGAEYGNFQGGLINIVTKSGSNTLQGQLRTFYENRTFNASNVNAFEVGSELNDRVEVNAELRGPLVRDKLYFYLSGQEARAQNRVVDFRSAGSNRVSWLDALTDRREQKYYGKLTWQASERDIINASAGIDNLTRERIGLSGFNSVDATMQGRSPSRFYQANWQRSLDARRFFEIKLSGYQGRDDELPYSGENVPAVVQLDVANSPQFNNSFYTRRNAPSSFGITGMYDTYFGTGALQHNLKVGAEYNVGLWREERTRNGGLTWFTEPGANFDPRNAATWAEIPSIGGGVYATADTGGRIDLAADSRNAALYIQDYIRVNDRLSINAGLRFGGWAGFITPGNQAPGFRGEKFEAVIASGFDPRIGASFDMTGNGTMVAKAHWGRYHQNLFALFFDRAPGANVFTNIEFCDWNDVDKSRLPDVGRPYGTQEFNELFTCFQGSNLFNEARVIEDYRQPYMDQLTLGLERSIGRNFKADVLYISRRNRAVLSLVDRNLAGNWAPLRNVAVSDARGPVIGADGQPVILPEVFVRNDDLRDRLLAGDNVPGYSLADTTDLNFVQDLVIRSVDDARRDFDQVQLQLNGVFARWSFNAALAWTNLTGNLFSVNGYFNPSGQENGPFVEPNLQTNFDGRLQNFSPWDFKLRASGQLPWGFEGGAFATLRSGDFWTPTLALNRQLEYAVEGQPIDNRVFQRTIGQQVLTETRGNRQFGTIANLDLRLQKVVSLRGSNAMIVGFEMFNLFNGNTVSAINESLNNQDPADPTSLLGAVRFRQPPTTFRMNVQYRF